MARYAYCAFPISSFLSPSDVLGMSPTKTLVKTYPTVKIHFPADMRLPTNESDDPLTRALAPPPNETQEERAVRVKKEIEAQRVSDAIDEAIRQEKNALKKKRAMKMLLLGQSESGMWLILFPRSIANIC